MDQPSGKRHCIPPPIFEIDAEEPRQGTNLRTVRRVAQSAATAAASGKADAEAVQQALTEILAQIANIGQGGVIAVNGKEGVVTLSLADFPDIASVINEKADASALSTLATGLSGKADTTHSHGIADTSGLQGALDAKAPLTSGIIDTTLTKSGTSFVIDTTSFPAPLPQFVTIRAKAPTGYSAGDTLTVNTTLIALSTPGGTALPGDAWVSGSVVEVTIDTVEERAFFKYGVGEASYGEVAWNIFPGMTPYIGANPGLYIPDANAPTLILVDGHFEIAGVKISSIACGYGHTIFLLEDGNVWSCGLNNRGQLGRVVVQGSSTFVNLGQITSISGVKFVACGQDHSIFIREDGTVWSCGLNDYGQLGRIAADGSSGSTNLGQLMGISNAKCAACGYFFTVIVREDGTTWSCGQNDYGQLGRAVASGSATSVNLGQIAGISNIKTVACGQSHTTFLLANTTVWNCGLNSYGQLGRVVVSSSATSINLGQVITITNVTDVACGNFHTIFLVEDGFAWSCGLNNSGQLGRVTAHGATTSANLGHIAGITSIKQISCRYYFSIFLLEDGTVWNCGQNNYGQLGRPIADGTPMVMNHGQVAAISAVKYVVCGRYYALFVSENNMVWNCGANNFGQLGRMTDSGSTSATNVDSLDSEVFGPIASRYQEGTLLIKVGKAGAGGSSPIYQDKVKSVSVPIENVYQVRDGQNIKLDFQIAQAS